MGVSIIGATEQHDLDFNWTSWAYLRAVGKCYGWQPAGTYLDMETLNNFHGGAASEDELREEVTKWNGDYDCNCSQIVRPEDARAWAAALSLALEDRLARTRKDRKPVNEDTFLWFEPRARALIATCLAGDFAIY